MFDEPPYGEEDTTFFFDCPSAIYGKFNAEQVGVSMSTLRQMLDRAKDSARAAGRNVYNVYVTTCNCTIASRDFYVLDRDEIRKGARKARK